MPRLFVSHSSRDGQSATSLFEWLKARGFEHTFLDFDKEAGIHPGSDWERTLYRQIDRCDALVIILTPNWLSSKWCFAEFTQARALGKVIIPLIASEPIGALVAADIQHLDLTSDREAALNQLERTLRQIESEGQAGFELPQGRPAFPGLMAFQEEDAAIFFGRDPEIREAIERLNARRVQGGPRIQMLFAASGAGKSSLMRAGVIPRLRRNGRAWIIAPPFRPGAKPMDELAQSLSSCLPGNPSWREVRQRLAGPDLRAAFSDVTRDMRSFANANEAGVLICVDQAEEAFTTATPDERDAFLSFLSAAFDPQQPHLAFLTMRADFLPNVQAAGALSAAYDVMSLRQMPVDRVPDIIHGPARVAGLMVEPGLAPRAMADLASQDALPLLAFALRELHDRCGPERALSVAGYDALGDPALGISPLENAVRKAADRVIAETKPTTAELDALKDAFVSGLALLNDQGDFVRQSAIWETLPAGSTRILTAMIEARLLVSRSNADEARIVEVTHEALLRKWPLLADWLTQERAFLAWRNDLTRQEMAWAAARGVRRASFLLRGWHGRRAADFLKAKRRLLSPSQQDFIVRSRLVGHYGATALTALALLAIAPFAADWLEMQIANRSRAFAEFPAGTPVEALLIDPQALHIANMAGALTLLALGLLSLVRRFRLLWSKT
jgi:hypothetical protein